MENYADIISSRIQLKTQHVGNVLKLLDEGATIPFISRYRKEMTGSMNEVIIAEVRDLHEKLLELDKRRATILKTIDEQGKLTPELTAKIEEAETLTELEDLYLPYKPKNSSSACSTFPSSEAMLSFKNPSSSPLLIASTLCEGHRDSFSENSK